MSFRQTCFWLVLAAGLFSFIFFYQRHAHKPAAGQARILPQLEPAAVTSIQVRPSGPISLQIRADRTNASWRLTEPLAYPAQAQSIETLLNRLAKLTPATYITPAEIKARPNAEEAFGFSSPQASVILQQGDYRAHLLVGSRTAPGDQVFLQVVGIEGAYVAEADWLQLLPRTLNDWRDTSLLLVSPAEANLIAVTNNGKAFVLQRDTTNAPWRITWPFTEGARADNQRIQAGLEKLQTVRVLQFISDEKRTDLDNLGLAPAELEIALRFGSNSLASLQFGKALTNDATQVYARRAGQDSVFAVRKELLEPWRAPINEFRDQHLITLAGAVAAIEVSGAADFSIECQTNGTWYVEPEHFIADRDLMREFLTGLGNLRIVQFVKDVVNPPDLPEFGLAAPVRQYRLRFAPVNGVPPWTNTIQFGLTTNQPGRMFARRTDESCVYAVNTNDFARLPARAWELRNRRLWDLSETNVARVTLRQDGRVRQLLRRGDHQWSLAPGSQGIINDLAVEETVRGLCNVSVAAWVARGPENLGRFGITPTGRQIAIEPKSGSSFTLEFGGEAPSGAQFAAARLDDQVWVFEFPWALYRDVVSYLSVP